MQTPTQQDNVYPGATGSIQMQAAGFLLTYQHSLVKLWKNYLQQATVSLALPETPGHLLARCSKTKVTHHL